MRGALSGIKVLDFSTLLPGPMATLFLAEAGAEVIKIERPGRGDEMRSYSPQWGGEAVNFHMLNRGKKSIALDLKDPASFALLQPLIVEADIIIEQFRPGVMARNGLGYDDLRAVNPGLIYCSITGYGQNGPSHAEAGHDLNYIGRTGMLALSPGTAEVPVIPPALIADIAAGTYPALLNILLALRQRDQTGEGAYIDIAMADNLFPFLYWALGEGEATGQWPGAGNSLVTGGSPRYRLYSSADGRFVAVAALEQKFWDRFTDLIGLDHDLRDDSADPEATSAAIAAILGTRSAADWEQLLGAADCCCTIVHTVSEARLDPHFVARGLFDDQIADEDGQTMTALPTPVTRAFRADRGKAVAAPKLGGDNDILLRKSGDKA